jgi:prepilin-type N-terminal cleavage/methylation domain-containing protein
MNSANPSGKARGNAKGMTLVELMVATGVGSVLLASIVMVFVTSNKTFVSMGNYVAMEQASRSALDQMTRDIRKSKNLLTFTTNQLVFNYSGATNLTYLYNPSTRQLLQWKTGGSTNVLLSNCDSLKFTMFSNIPQAGGTFTTTTSVSQGKCISVAWRCSRAVLGKKINTEDMQEAQIVIRNKPVL